MNKRHYEHTLPNIRGSLSNTYPEKESDDCSREEEQDDGVHRDDPLVVKQAYSCEQDQRYRLSADFFDELQFHVLYNFKYE